ncbi:unnamed protein product [Amoebophrya sp. A25]|nr:unnamed protein product [Amoebophrya sp. A25]|eukprot:GSA25T00013094001.1
MVAPVLVAGDYILLQKADGSRLTAPRGIGVEYQEHAQAEFVALLELETSLSTSANAANVDRCCDNRPLNEQNINGTTEDWTEVEKDREHDVEQKMRTRASTSGRNCKEMPLDVDIVPLEMPLQLSEKSTTNCDIDKRTPVKKRSAPRVRVWRVRGLDAKTAERIGSRLVASDLLRVLPSDMGDEVTEDGTDMQGSTRQGQEHLFPSEKVFCAVYGLRDQQGDRGPGVFGRDYKEEIRSTWLSWKKKNLPTAVEIRKPVALRDHFSSQMISQNTSMSQNIQNNKRDLRFFAVLTVELGTHADDEAVGIWNKQMNGATAPMSTAAGAADVERRQPSRNSITLTEAVGYSTFVQRLTRLEERRTKSRCGVRPALALLMANLGKVDLDTDIVLDPFCGVGSLLSLPHPFFEDTKIGDDHKNHMNNINCGYRHVRFPSCRIGSDVDGEGFAPGALERVVADIRRCCWRRCDAILADPPFGLREFPTRNDPVNNHKTTGATSTTLLEEQGGVNSSNMDKKKPIVRRNNCYIGDRSSEELLRDAKKYVGALLACAFKCLAPGQRLVYLFPVFPCQAALGLWDRDGVVLRYEKQGFHRQRRYDPQVLPAHKFLAPSSVCANHGTRQEETEEDSDKRLLNWRLLERHRGFALLSATVSPCRSGQMARLVVVMQRIPVLST